MAPKMTVGRITSASFACHTPSPSPNATSPKSTMPTANARWSLLIISVLRSANSVVVIGLAADCTSPSPIDIKSDPAKSMANPLAASMIDAPAQIGGRREPEDELHAEDVAERAENDIVSGKPQRPAPPIQPTCMLFKPKASFSGSMIAVMAMNRAADTAMATRPAQKSRCGWI